MTQPSPVPPTVVPEGMRVALGDKRPLNLTAAGLTLVCAALWGGQSVAVKTALHDLPPYFVMCLRIALCCAFAVAWAVTTAQPLRLRFHEFRLVVLNSMILYLQMALYTIGTGWTTSVRSILIINSFPFFTALTCHFFLPGFPLTRRTLSGLLIAFAGLGIVFGNRHAFTSGDWRGDLLILAAAMVMGAKIAYVKVLLRRLRPVQLLFWGSLLASPTFLLLSLLFENVKADDFTTEAMLAVCYQGICVSGLALLLWGYLLSRHAPSDLTVFRLTTPLIGMALGWLILNESLDYYFVLGAILLLIGIYRVVA